MDFSKFSTIFSPVMNMYTKLGLFIGGKWIYEAEKGENVLNPADESILGWLPHATKDNLNDALKSSEIGFDQWKNTNPNKRSRIILKAADTFSLDAPPPTSKKFAGSCP